MSQLFNMLDEFLLFYSIKVSYTFTSLKMHSRWTNIWLISWHPCSILTALQSAVVPTLETTSLEPYPLVSGQGLILQQDRRFQIMEPAQSSSWFGRTGLSATVLGRTFQTIFDFHCRKNVCLAVVSEKGGCIETLDTKQKLEKWKCSKTFDQECR